MIKAVIFDVGGVLIRTSEWSMRREWEVKLGLDSGQADVLVFGEPMGLRAQLGEISYEELWIWIGQELKLSQTELAAFRSDFWANDYLDQELVSLLEALKSSYKLAIISNNMDNLRRALTKNYPIADYFDVIVNSAEEGIMKPDKEIYIRALKRLNVLATETIFIDDNEENVRAAEDVGMAAIRFYPEMNLAAELTRRGINIGDQ